MTLAGSSRSSWMAAARRLFAWELNGEWDVFAEAASVYADVLGAEGLAVYRELAEAEWDDVPALGPGEDDPERWGRRFRITNIMLALARVRGDVDEEVAVLERDLSTPYRFLRIAERCREAEHPEDVLAVYREAVERCVDRRNKDAYAEAVARLGRIRDVLAALGREDEFSDYLESVRGDHRRKRNFMKLLEKAAWSR